MTPFQLAQASWDNAEPEEDGKEVPCDQCEDWAEVGMRCRTCNGTRRMFVSDDYGDDDD